MAHYLLFLLLFTVFFLNTAMTLTPIPSPAVTPNLNIYSTTAKHAPSPSPIPTSTRSSNTTTTTTATLAPSPSPTPASTRSPNTTTTTTATLASSPSPTPTSARSLNTTAAPILVPKPSPAPTRTVTPNSTSTTAAICSPAPSPAFTPNGTTSAATTTITTVITAPPPPRHIHHGYRQQLNNIIDALIGAGDFNIWANVLSVADPSTLPISATLFIPADDSRSPIATTITIDPYIFPYHIVPQRLSFVDLGQFKLYSRLPTLLPGKSILVTNSSISNYTLDGSLVSHPDLYTNANIAVHGIATLLDYSVYGDAYTKVPQPEVLSRPPQAMFVPEGDLIGDHRSETNSACLCSEVWTVFWIFSAVLASKVQRFSLFSH
ncbi:hypothetical protein JCGZ_09169 [Jatropha curcas]|uniref:FAS1 domain-containing protein n=1 Tax=Jatropha curcas TaxID=180498 RepID=A0A067KF76_JATCU|nr:mucin-2 [Jatropha curcas]KDP34881.1 hypothetical protein JCGZ_09169 [Jatropha curcas]